MVEEVAACTLEVDARPPLDPQPAESHNQQPQPQQPQQPKNKKRKKAKVAQKGYAFKPVSVPFGSDFLVRLYDNPVEAISPSPKTADILHVKYVLYDNLDRFMCVYVELKDSSCRYLLVPTGECKLALADYKERMSDTKPLAVSLAVENKGPDNDPANNVPQYRTLQQLRENLEKFALAALATDRKQRSRAARRCDNAAELALQVSRLMEQLALQARLLNYRVEQPSPYELCRSNLDDLLLETKLVVPVYATVIKNNPWLFARNRLLLPDEETLEELLRRDQPAERKSRLSTKRKEFEDAYAQLVEEQKKRRRRKTKAKEAPESEPGPQPGPGPDLPSMSMESAEQELRPANQ